MKTVPKVIAAGVVVLTVLGLLDGPTSLSSVPSSSDWRVARSRGAVFFVVLTPGRENKRPVYDAAIRALCTGGRACAQVSFYAEGDSVPSEQAFAASGFRGFNPLAVYWGGSGGGFTTWDCERAGSGGAPLDALCGPGVREAFGAVLSLAGRTSTAAACGWPQTDDAARFAAYLLTVEDPGRREQYRRAFDDRNTRGGPDDRADCIRLRERLEERASAARTVLGISPPGQPAPQAGGRDRAAR